MTNGDGQPPPKFSDLPPEVKEYLAKPGHWTCPTCGNKNFYPNGITPGRRLVCRKCELTLTVE